MEIRQNGLSIYSPIWRNLKGIFSICLVLITFQLFLSCSDSSSSVKNSNNEPFASSITQFGITWTFDKKYNTGQFVNGDYWVIGPVSIIGISPNSVTVDGRTINGSMLNPSPLTEESATIPDVYYYNQGYDSGCEFVVYNSSRNVALNISSETPLVLPGGSSLISVISRTTDEINSDADNKTMIRTAAVLTVLSGKPADGSFRPPYTGTDKSTKYNIGTIFGTGGTIGFLKKLAPVANTPSLSEVERLFERPWIDHAVESWTNRTFHPLENMKEYHREFANDVGIGALMLHLNFTDEEKKTLLIRYIQLGIDFYEIYKLGYPRYPGESAAGAARKWPIIFAGIMLKDADMQGVGVKSGYYIYSFNYPAYGPGNAPADYGWFGEDSQIFHVTQEDISRTNSASWKPDYRTAAPERYQVSDIGMPEWGIHHAADPFQSDRSWGATYRQCCSLYAWIGYLLAARIMDEDCGTLTLWNNPDLFNYADRYMAISADSSLNPAWRTSLADPLWGTTTVDDIWGTDPGWRYFSYFTSHMWDEYRDDF